MVSVEYLKTTARLQESVLDCESKRLSLEQKLKALKSGSNGATSTALSGYYQDLCQRETSMQRRAQQLLADLDRSEASFRTLERRVGQLRARRDAILAEHGPHWRDELIDFLRRRTSDASEKISGSVSFKPDASKIVATPVAGTLLDSATVDSGVPPLHLSQLSKSGGGSTAAAKAAAVASGSGAAAGGGWNTSGALLGLTESTMDSTAFSRSGSQLGDTARQKTPRSSLQQQQQEEKHSPPAPNPKLTETADVSDLTVHGLHRLLDFIDAEMKRAQPRILASYYATSPPSDAMRNEICRAANSDAGIPSHLSAVSATALLLEELDALVDTRLPSRCVFTDSLVSALSGMSDPRQLVRQIDMNIGDELARELWHRLLRHMRQLKLRTDRSSLDIARLFCPALLPMSSKASVADRLVRETVRILDCGADDDGIDDVDGDDDDDESLTIASDRKPQPQKKPQRPPSPKSAAVAESMQATAGSFVDEGEADEDEDVLEDDDDDDDFDVAKGKTPTAAAAAAPDSLNVTRNPELRASSSDAHVRAYAAALQDDSADESSITELTMQSGTNRSGFFSHNSPQPNLKGSSAYQKLLQGALGASANLAASKSSDDQTEPTTSKAPPAGAGGGAAASKEISGGPSQSDDKQWKPTVIAKDDIEANDTDHDLESDIDSELENSFRLRLSGGGTLKSQLQASQASQQRKPQTHAEDDDEDFGGFYD